MRLPRAKRSVNNWQLEYFLENDIKSSWNFILKVLKSWHPATPLRILALTFNFLKFGNRDDLEHPQGYFQLLHKRILGPTIQLCIRTFKIWDIIMHEIGGWKIDFFKHGKMRPVSCTDHSFSLIFSKGTTLLLQWKASSIGWAHMMFFFCNRWSALSNRSRSVRRWWVETMLVLRFFHAEAGRLAGQRCCKPVQSFPLFAR